MKTLGLITISVVLLFLLACYDKNKEVYCTMEFRSIGLQIEGPKLESYYTIRLFNGDTLRPQAIEVDEHFYTVIDDSYQKVLENRRESFLFVGLINDSVKVKELFEIAADQCHVQKINGKEKVIL
jgi:hypothetical protein